MTIPHKNGRCMQGRFIHFGRVSREYIVSAREENVFVCLQQPWKQMRQRRQVLAGIHKKAYISPISSFIKRMFVLHILFSIRVDLKDSGGEVDSFICCL